MSIEHVMLAAFSKHTGNEPYRARLYFHFNITHLWYSDMYVMIVEANYTHFAISNRKA